MRKLRRRIWKGNLLKLEMSSRYFSLTPKIVQIKIKARLGVGTNLITGIGFFAAFHFIGKRDKPGIV